MSSEKICLYTYNFIQKVIHYFINIIPYHYLEQYTKKIHVFREFSTSYYQ